MMDDLDQEDRLAPRRRHPVPKGEIGEGSARGGVTRCDLHGETGPSLEESLIALRGNVDDSVDQLLLGAHPRRDRRNADPEARREGTQRQSGQSVADDDVDGSVDDHILLDGVPADGSCCVHATGASGCREQGHPPLPRAPSKLRVEYDKSGLS